MHEGPARYANRAGPQTTPMCASLLGIAPAALHSGTSGVEIDASFVCAVLELKYSQRASGIGQVYERLVGLDQMRRVINQEIAHRRK